LSFGSSLNAVLFGLDEGFYYRSWGGELTSTNVAGGGFTWRLFGERQWDANVETQFSLANAMNNVEFMENIDATRGTIGGAEARYSRTFGLNPAGWRLLTDMRAEAAAGTFDYTRGALDATLSRGLGGGVEAAITGSAGTSGGALPPQRMWYIGGSHTVRGQRPSLDLAGQSGNSYWLGRGELGKQFTAVRPSVFYDVGWAGDRSAWSHPGRPVSGAGVGVSILDGLIRADLSRGIWPRKRTLLDLYFEARF
jgi:hemolysin activation/secretion protein